MKKTLSFDFMIKNISDKVIDKIKQGKITPRSRWDFLFKNYSFWLMTIFCVFLGSLSISICIFLLKKSSLMEYHAFDIRKVVYLISIFWLLILSVFLVLAYLNFKKTDNGYKFRTSLIFILCFIASFVVGIFLYFGGFGENIEESMYQNVPIYQRIYQKHNFSNPSISGNVLIGSFRGGNEREFLLADSHGNLWQVFPKNKNQFIAYLPLGARLFLMGGQVNEYVFEAEEIRPLFRTKKMKKIFMLSSERNN